MENNLRIGPIKYPEFISAGVSLWMPSLDSGFYKFLTVPLVFGNSIGINNRNTVLSVYQYYRSDSWGVAALFARLTENNIGKLDTLSTKIIPLNQTTELGSIYYCFDHYFVSTTITKRIAEDGTAVTCFSRAIYNMFRMGTDLYGMSFGKVVTSKDAGTSWSEIGDINFGLEIVQYVETDGEVFALSNDNILHVTIADSMLTVEEIDNDGLSNQQITSLKRYRNDMYAVSLSGIFARPIQTFYTYKHGTKRFLIR
jgi:hypothetical protein